jgi:hypothetical protein
MLSSLRSPIPVLLSLLLGLPIVFSGCRSFPGDDPPLPDSTFTRVLVDLHLTTARGERLSSLPSGIEDSVFARHGVRREEVDATLRYYARQPEDLETLYNGVIDTLSALQTRLRSRQDTTEEESEAP